MDFASIELADGSTMRAVRCPRCFNAMISPPEALPAHLAGHDFQFRRPGRFRGGPKTGWKKRRQMSSTGIEFKDVIKTGGQGRAR